MGKNGALLLVHALEQIGVKVVFGIPGVHNIEIYNQLLTSQSIEPIITTSELSAGYMTDAVSRTSESIGAMVVTPGAGLTSSLTAIANAFMSSIPMIVIVGGIDNDSEKGLIVNDINMQSVSTGLIKRYFNIDKIETLIPTVYDAYNTAISGEPGPVIIEIPLQIQKTIYNKNTLLSLSKHNDNNDKIRENKKQYSPDDAIIKQVSDLLSGASNPGICVGWGARKAINQVKRISELLAAPVCTSIQGVNSFSYKHPLHTGTGYVFNSSPTTKKIFEKCNCLLAIGTKFSYSDCTDSSMKPPKSLIHIDINPEVFNKRYKSHLAIEGKAEHVLDQIIENLNSMTFDYSKTKEQLVKNIANEKELYRQTWFANLGEDSVTPGFFFNALRRNFPEDTILVADDGRHASLASELFTIGDEGMLICPTNFSAVGYGVSAAISTKLENNDKTVISIINDGALLFAGNELLTTYTKKISILIFVFRNKKDFTVGENKEQAEKFTLNDIHSTINIEHYAKSVKAEYLKMLTDIETTGILEKAKTILAKRQSVIVEVDIDYSKMSSLFSCSLHSKSNRLSLTDKIKLLLKIK